MIALLFLVAHGAGQAEIADRWQTVSAESFATGTAFGSFARRNCQNSVVLASDVEALPREIEGLGRLLQDAWALAREKRIAYRTEAIRQWLAGSGQTPQIQRGQAGWLRLIRAYCESPTSERHNELNQAILAACAESDNFHNFVESHLTELATLRSFTVYSTNGAGMVRKLPRAMVSRSDGSSLLALREALQELTEDERGTVVPNFSEVLFTGLVPTAEFRVLVAPDVDKIVLRTERLDEHGTIVSKGRVVIPMSSNVTRGDPLVTLGDFKDPWKTLFEAKSEFWSIVEPASKELDNPVAVVAEEFCKRLPPADGPTLLFLNETLARAFAYQLPANPRNAIAAWIKRGMLVEAKLPGLRLLWPASDKSGEVAGTKSVTLSQATRSLLPSYGNGPLFAAAAESDSPYFPMWSTTLTGLAGGFSVRTSVLPPLALRAFLGRLGLRAWDEMATGRGHQVRSPSQADLVNLVELFENYPFWANDLTGQGRRFVNVAPRIGQVTAWRGETEQRVYEASLGAQTIVGIPELIGDALAGAGDPAQVKLTRSGRQSVAHFRIKCEAGFEWVWTSPQGGETVWDERLDSSEATAARSLIIDRLDESRRRELAMQSVLRRLIKP